MGYFFDCPCLLWRWSIDACFRNNCEVTDGLSCAGEAGFGGTRRDLSVRDKGLEATARGDRRRLKGIPRATWSKGIRAGRATWFGPAATRTLGPNPAETLGSTPPGGAHRRFLYGPSKGIRIPFGIPFKGGFRPAPAADQIGDGGVDQQRDRGPTLGREVRRAVKRTSLTECRLFGGDRTWRGGGRYFTY